MVRALLNFVGLLNASRRSLKTKIIVVTLAIFVAGIWSLTFYATRNLRSDMVRLLGEQQFSTVTLVAQAGPDGPVFGYARDATAQAAPDSRWSARSLRDNPGLMFEEI